MLRKDDSVNVNCLINLGGRQYEDDGRRRHNDDHPPSARRGGYDRERYGGGQQRRDHDSVRSNKYNHPDRGTQSCYLFFSHEFTHTYIFRS